MERGNVRARLNSPKFPIALQSDLDVIDGFWLEQGLARRGRGVETALLEARPRRHIDERVGRNLVVAAEGVGPVRERCGMGDRAVWDREARPLRAFMIWIVLGRPARRPDPGIAVARCNAEPLQDGTYVRHVVGRLRIGSLVFGRRIARVDERV